MVSLTIDGKKIKAQTGTTILAAAKKMGINIPVLCYLENYAHHTSCMVCLVEDKKKQRLIPACAALVEEGMEIDTRSPEVLDARRTSLELLLSEHTGDCQAPCQRTCPGGLNIPAVLRQVAGGHYPEALSLMLEHFALPSLLCTLCPAPCEKNCRRKQHDEPVAIRLLTLVAGRSDEDRLFLPTSKPATGKKVAVIGAGPAGLSAAFYLLSSGHEVSIFEKADAACSLLSKNCRPELKIGEAVRRESQRLKALGAVFHFGTGLGKDINLKELQKDFAAVIMAMGFQEPQTWSFLGLGSTERGIAVLPHTFATNREKVFACGSCLRKHKSAVTSAAQGRICALAVDSFLLTGQAEIKHPPFDGHLGKLRNGELKEFLKEALDIPRLHFDAENGRKPSLRAVRQEAGRCLHCDCRKADDCALRVKAGLYQAHAGRYRGEERRPVQKIISDSGVVYEPGKCIKCGRCVRITEAKKEKLGLTFIGRGFQVQVGVPFKESLSRALTHTRAECVKACPTGALAFFKGKG
jgi:ferredoxin